MRARSVDEFKISVPRFGRYTLEGPANASALPTQTPRGHGLGAEIQPLRCILAAASGVLPAVALPIPTLTRPEQAISPSWGLRQVGMGRTNEERKYLEKKSNGKLQGEILKSNKFQASVKRCAPVCFFLPSATPLGHSPPKSGRPAPNSQISLLSIHYLLSDFSLSGR